MKVFGICAVDDNFGFGYDNCLPWVCKSDLTFFSNTTQGHHGIMGRNTWESMPQSRIIKNRIVHVISKTPRVDEYVTYSCSLDEALVQISDTECYIIGGMNLLEEGLRRNLIEVMYVTKIKGIFQCDVYFPSLPSLLESYTPSIIEEHDDCIIYKYTKLP